MDTIDQLELSRLLSGYMVDPTPPQANPWDELFYPLEETPAEYLPLEGTGFTLEELLEDLLSDLVAPGIFPQQSFLQPGPVHCHTQQTETHTKHLEVKLTPVGEFDQKVIPGAPGDRVPPPVNARRPRKRKRGIEEEEEYVKKPPNAFMLYRQEQTPKVLADLKNSGCAAVNTIIGQMWKALSQEQQQTYYEESGRLTEIHSQLYPGWSSRDNYGKKRKRSPRRLSRKWPSSKLCFNTAEG